MALVSINPSTGKKIQSYAELAEEEVKIILNNVHTAKDKWAFSDLSLRLNCVSEMIGVLKDNKREFSPPVYIVLLRKNCFSHMLQTYDSFNLISSSRMLYQFSNMFRARKAFQKEGWNDRH